MANYQVITDSSAMCNFIETLPQTAVNERYYFCLFARKKYCKDIKYIKSDKSQLSRKVATRDRIFHKIKQMECELGTYRQDEVAIPQEALALYINPNPRCMRKATFQNLKKLADVVCLDSSGFCPASEAMSCIQRSVSRKIWLDFDIDTKEGDILQQVYDILKNRSCYRVLETRGGYHILVKSKDVPESAGKFWYNSLAKLADIKGDCMIPVPGSYQGGFTPRFIEPIEELTIQAQELNMGY